PSAFLTNVLRVGFQLDSEPLPSGNQINMKNTRGDNPISSTTWYDTPLPVYHTFPGETGLPADTPPGSKSLYLFDPTPTWPYREGSAGNQASTDSVTFNAPAAPLVSSVEATFAPTGDPAIMFWQDPAKGSAVIFSPFGWESINPENYTPPMQPPMANGRA